MRRWMWLVSMLVGMALLCALVPLRRVAGDEMAWTLRDGDLVWVIPARIRRGDVVMLSDPLDSTRLIFRRAVADGGQKVRYDVDGLRINGKRIRQTEMGRDQDHRVVKEVLWSSPPARPNRWFPRYTRQKTVRWALPEKVEVPDGHWFLLADDRDGSLDSRWWGPIPEGDIQGVIRLRFGEADIWREKALEVLLPEE